MMARNLRRLGMLVVAATVVLAGCQTTDPYTGEQKVSKTTKGAAIGAAAGAAVGLITGDNSRERKKRALIGAGVGGVAGGAVGNYMDRQEAKLREQLQGTGVSVTRVGDEIILNMPGNITFATSSADINASFYPVLNSVGVVLKEFDKTVVDVGGHADSTGSDQINVPLSQNRAQSVATYLQSQGVNGQRFLVSGYGSARPIASNDTADGRQQNRRVEITLAPLVQ